MTQWYKVDSRKLTYAELWRFANSFQKFLDLVFLRWIGKQIDFKGARSRLDGIIHCELSEFGDASVKIEVLIRDVVSCGFKFQFFYKTQSLGISRGCAVTLLSDDGLLTAHAIYTRTKIGAITRTALAFFCISKQRDSRILCTTDQPQKFDLPPWDTTVRVVGAQPNEIIERHRSWVQSQSKELVHFSADEVERFIIDSDNRTLDHWIDRGLAIPMKDHEVKTLQKFLDDQDSKPSVTVIEEKPARSRSRFKRSVARWINRSR